ncbi:MAG: hypothetical protein KJ804_18755, partial [Proteobacteria bacterium]|nr:hypothetical protein [Pseudomonadota bacterium]
GIALTSDIDVNESEPTGTIDEQAPQAVLGLANGNFVILYEDDNDNTGNKEDFFVRTFEGNSSSPVVTLALSGSPLSEDGGVATVSANLSASSGQDVTVTLAFSGTAADGGTDYTASATSIVIPGGSLSGSITLTAVADTLDETDETIIVDITAVTNATESGSQQVIATITDDDLPPTVTLALTGSPLPENTGIAAVSADLSIASGRDVTVTLALSGTASPGGIDYTASGLFIVIPTGSLSGSITLSSVNDTLDEVDETVIIDITTVTNGTESGTQQVTAIITDDDTPPTVTLALSGDPLAENGGVALVIAELSTMSGRAVTVTLALSGTASGEGTDYTASGTSILIPAGNLSANISLTADDDALDEVNETIIVNITAVTNGTESGSQQITATITDDDPAPTATLALTGSPLAENGGVSTVSVELSAVTALDVTVALALSGTASGGGTDYTASGTSILIPAGSLNGAITLTSVDDALDETDETIIVDINTVTNGTESGTQQIIATIADDDASPSVTFTSAGQSQGEQHAEMTVTVELSTLSGRDVTVPYSLGGTALEGGAADYTIPASPIVIPAGTLQQHIIITVINDSERETTETIIVTMEPPLNAAQGSIIVHTASIIDNDEPEIEVSGNDISITAGAQIPLVENATDFGRLPTTEEAISHTFSIKNTGTIDLHLTGDPIVAISGECAESYSIIAMPSPVISAGEATPFSVEFAPKGRELCQALIQINNDDADEASFDFVIQGSKDGMPWILIQILPALKQATDRNNIEN